ncbi:Pleckstrin homology domain-containing family M member 3 [Morus notabilis]|uniref:Pleckstrin homology domain-containing family M member 3 n=1 Tax=Morus notabilis TaxID=981085 RepID=W9QL23_9ROSA|nr:uncharacterized protein LOC21386997 isoform X2 [Morus notabilis]EXB29616.1 Pleckstrin homology domain-containing family M member 3 [Morus notabilis]
MINGEGTGKILSGIAPPDPFDQKSDDDGGAGAGDATPSRYSSCGESEFERYCSANSAMGTPSMCSTITVFNDFPELEFGSGRNLGLGFGDDGGGLENFSLGGKIERNREETKRLSDDGVDRVVRGQNSSVNYGSSGLEMYGGDELDDFGAPNVNELMSWKVDHKSSPLKGISGFDNGSDKGDSVEDDQEVVGKSSVVQMGTQESNGSQVLPEVDECGSNPIGGGEERQEDGTSSRDEHSESGDSMYRYGTDDEGKNVDVNYYKNVHYSQEAKTKNENPLLINSSVAFGSDDWDDFEQGSELASVSFIVSASENRKEKNVEAEKEVSGFTPLASVGFPSTCQIEEAKCVNDMPGSRNQVEGGDKLDELEEVEDVKDIPVASYQVQGSSDLFEFTKSSFTTPPVLSKVDEPENEDISPYTENHVRGDVCNIELDPLAEKLPEKTGFNDINDGLPLVHQKVNTEEAINVTASIVYENLALGNSKIKLDRLGDSSTNQINSRSTVFSGKTRLDLLDDSKPKTDPSTFNNNMRKNPHVSEDPAGVHPAPVKTDALEINEFYDEVVLEMEEILLASSESPGARFPHSNRAIQSQPSLPLRDGGSSASTSGMDEAYPFVQHPLRIDGIEVVGARQKKGDVSFSERLVGVKEYTVYKIRVWSGNDEWEVERRYRDFFTLYRRLKTLFTNQGLVLPSPWATVEKESRKIFGNASPTVIAERSVLIQDCLRSILHPRIFTTSPSALIWFLCPQDSVPSSLGSNSVVPQSISRGSRENISTLGKTISLIVEIQPYKSTKQMLEAQHYTCAGCYKHFDDGKTLIRDFAQTLGWGKPRLCEYTGQLFCSSCHTNETAVLPARVLHNWDFTQYPVSQLAKSYLDSIYDQPMLCVSAVNPFLFTKVPALHHVMGVRRKIGIILSYVRCSFRESINRGLGSRRYLLESNDFFALRDLIDLSKGAFAALPVMVETVLKKIVEHITDQCLICCDVGVPCNARQACNDPSSLIFPFQEGDVGKCVSCESVFHKLCFKKLTECPCGAHLGADDRRRLATRVDLLGKGLSSGLSVGFLSALFTKAKPDKIGEHKDDDNVILMGSLPSTSL